MSDINNSEITQAVDGISVTELLRRLASGTTESRIEAGLLIEKYLRQYWVLGQTKNLLERALSDLGPIRREVLLSCLDANRAYLWAVDANPEADFLAPGELRSSSELALYAVLVLLQSGRAAQAVLPEIQQLLGDRPWTPICADLLCNMGEDAALALPALLQNLRNWQYGEIGRAIALASVDEPTVVPRLIELFRSSNEDEKFGAIQCIGLLGERGRVAVPHLLDLANELDGYGLVVEALGRVGKGNPRVFEILLKAMHDEHCWTRGHAAIALGWEGWPADRAVLALAKALRDDEGCGDRLPYMEAVQSLKFYGAAAAQALPDLIRAFQRFRNDSLFDENRYDNERCFMGAFAAIGPAASVVLHDLRSMIQERGEGLWEDDVRLIQQAIDSIEGRCT